MIIRDVLKELFGMFIADRRLTAATLLLVVVTALLRHLMSQAPLWAGALLLVGAMAILVGAVIANARVLRR